MSWETVAKLSARYLGSEVASVDSIVQTNGKLSDNGNSIVQENRFRIEKEMENGDEAEFVTRIDGLKCDIIIRGTPHEVAGKNVKLSSEGFPAPVAKFNIDCEQREDCVTSCQDYKSNVKNPFEYWRSMNTNEKECLVDIDYKSIWASSKPLGPCPGNSYPKHYFDQVFTIPLFHPNGTVLKTNSVEMRRTEEISVL